VPFWRHQLALAIFRKCSTSFQCAQEAISLPGIVKIISDLNSMCNTTKIVNLIVIEPIPASFPCVLAKENNTVVTAICRDLGAKRLVKYLTDWIGQLS
jgi:hypothetical protein